MTKPCQGQNEVKIDHEIDWNERDQKYTLGVSFHMSALFDFSKEPWRMLESVIRQMIIAYQVIKYTKLDRIEDLNLKILDAGCGFGELFTYLDRWRKAKGVKLNYVGIDIDEDKQALAKELRPKIDFRICDVTKLENFDDSNFDCIVSEEVLEHLTFEEGNKMLTDLVGMIATNGIFILSAYTPLGNQFSHDYFDHLRCWTMEEATEAIISRGLTIIDSFYVSSPVNKMENIPDLIRKRAPYQLYKHVMSLSQTIEGTDLVIISKKEKR